MMLERRTELVRLTESAMAVALSVLLGNIRLVELPNGGSIALAVLPLLTLAVARGARTALLAGCCAGVAHALAGGTIIHPVQLMLDYVVAYGVLAVAGLGARPGRMPSRRYLTPWISGAMLLHLAAMVTSGMVFFAPVAGSAAFAYSLAYNAATVVPETLLAVWLVPPLLRAMARANPADAWRRGLLPPPSPSPRTPRSMDATTPIDTVDPAAPVPANIPRSVCTAPPAPRLVRHAPLAAPQPFASLRLRSAPLAGRHEVARSGGYRPGELRSAPPSSGVTAS